MAIGGHKKLLNGAQAGRNGSQIEITGYKQVKKPGLNQNLSLFGPSWS